MTDAGPLPSSQPRRPYTHLALVVMYLYGFLVAVTLMSSAIKLMGQGSATGLFDGVSHPLAALAVGILATVLVQSSSVTTATIVALVGSGQLPLLTAVPMVMGANIGTTVTNTLVSIGTVRRTQQFRRAFACATMHDVFNFMVVAVLLPIEIATGFLRKTAVWMADHLAGSASLAGGYESPIKVAVKAGAHLVKDALAALGLEGGWLGAMLLLAALGLIFWCLMAITRHMRVLFIARIEASLNRALARTGLLGIAIGVAITVAVQSSSITTSLLVPMCAAGILTLENAFPITLGANIGTTVTALLASLAADSSAGLAIALVHLLFNLTGTALVFPSHAMRRIPVRVARRLAILTVRNKMWIAIYVGTMFVLLPILGLWLLG